MMQPAFLRAALALSLLGGAAAAQISQEFQDKLARLAPQDRVPVLIVLREQLDVAAIDLRADRGNATRAQRHRMVVLAARELADRTQGALLAKMRQLETLEHVSGIQPFWVMNAVGARATVDAIAQLSLFPGIDHIEDGDAPWALIDPVENKPAGATPAATEPGLLDIKADFLWGLGYLGAGRLVSNIDTGVQMHTAFASRWRGNEPGVTVAETWHSPTLRAPAPADRNGHGTHTMGTMCGDDGTNRVGVAPMASWIASDAIFGSNLGQIRIDAIAAFQWSADPDGNPLTVRDVPDVSSNSWGYSPFFHSVPPCDNAFWQAIDVADAAGCVVVFAAGNEGSRGPQSLRTPADRATSATNAFSVAALNPGSTTLASFSSLGPSGCPGNAIKPEVAAQGASVRSTWPTNTFRNLSGTSMACPHVAGAVALLREVDPNLSSRQVKELLMASADDLGAAGEDNSFGHGRINLETAYNMLRAGQGAVTVGIVTTTGRVREGTNLVYEVSAVNHSQQSQLVAVAIEMAVPAINVVTPLIGPVPLLLPVGFNLEPDWPAFVIPVPAGLPPEFFTWGFELRISARDSNGALISSAHTDFVITR